MLRSEETEEIEGSIVLVATAKRIKFVLKEIVML